MLNLIYNVKRKSIIWGLVVGGLLHCLGANCLESLMPWNTFLGCQLSFSTLFAAKHLLGLEK